jgi:hypothetical protein
MEIQSFGCSWKSSFAISEDGGLYAWGEVDAYTEETSLSTPTLLQNWRWMLPRSSILRRWNSVFQWLFLGRLDKNSRFNDFHDEIIFNLAKLY